MNPIAPAILGALFLSATLSLPVQAKAGNTVFPDQAAHRGELLQLKSRGKVYYARLIHVYDAALYAPPAVDASALLNYDSPMCLKLHYRVTLERDKFVLAANRVLARQHSPETLEPLRERIEHLHAAYQDIEAGDQYTLCYLPGQTTELSLNTQALVSIKGADFARLYFGIWLGEQPISGKLKSALLQENVSLQGP